MNYKISVIVATYNSGDFLNEFLDSIISQSLGFEDIEVIFERYYSGKSLERKLGAGFGLSVCRHIIEMHGGEISVESELNKFTRFTIKLPLI